jgi:fumarate reductase flavoprotein subunit
MPAGTPEVPVAIVGAGACGLVAALALRDAGIDCVLLERDAQPQGSAPRCRRASSRRPARGAARGRRHRRQPRALCADIQAKAHGTAAPHLVAAYAQAIAPAIDALQQRHGLPSSCSTAFSTPATRVRRMHTLPQRTGAALMAALDAAAARAGAVTVTSPAPWCASCGATTRAACWASATSAPTAAPSTWPAACCCWPATASAATRRWWPNCCRRCASAVFAGHAGNDGSAIAWGRALGAGWPTWAAARAMARGRCRRAR